MAITTYTELTATIADFLNRQDLTDAIPSFIAMAEDAVNSDDRFRVMAGVTRSQATIDGSQTDNFGQYFLPVPQDYVSMLDLRLMELPPPSRLDMVTMTQMEDLRQTLSNGSSPRYYAVAGGTMEILPAPAPGSEYTMQMVYYGKLPPLSPTNPSNWLLNMNPSVYLYGALIHSAPYLKDDERISVWAGMYNNLAENINASDGRAQFSGSTMKIRTRRRYR
ncbi:hypothetical protein [Paraburkholderia terrae]|uniref:phage adaptor protein n=1 Tax=Paraburkholderia terrae TaxID=311230 RepID=UPI002070D3A4|nr:hypothetical protein [Paraburkholderia terrae]BDC37916.1 hypothetical protein PTKU15_12130 [Paraburkholderia terrae]